MHKSSFLTNHDDNTIHKSSFLTNHDDDDGKKQNLDPLVRSHAGKNQINFLKFLQIKPGLEIFKVSNQYKSRTRYLKMK